MFKIRCMYFENTKLIFVTQFVLVIRYAKGICNCNIFYIGKVVKLSKFDATNQSQK